MVCPSGIVSTVSAGVLTISGTLTDNIGANTQYSYTVTVTGGCPTSAVTTTGTIDALANHNMVISAGSATQTLCEGAAIADIDFTVSEGATGLPIFSWCALQVLL